MTLSFKDVEFRTPIPDIPTSLPIVEVSAQCLPERAAPVRTLAEYMGLRDVAEIDLPFGWALAGKSGQVECFAASGGIRGRNIELLDRFDNEARQWSDVRQVDGPDGPRWELGKEAGSDLVRRSQGLVNDLKLGAEAATVDVVVGQWAQLDDDGKERESGPGRATVKMSYAYEGMPFIGAGSKTNLHFDPFEGEAQLSRFFHVHRDTGGARSVAVGDVERAFAGLLADPLLVERAQGPGRVAITSLKVGLLALPADTQQRFAIPTVAAEGVIEGLVDPDDRPFELRFGRYVPMVDSDALAQAGVAIAPEMINGTIHTGDRRR